MRRYRKKPPHEQAALSDIDGIRRSVAVRACFPFRVDVFEGFR